MTFEGGFLFRPSCVGGVRVSLAVKAQKRGRYFPVKTIQSQANVMFASLVKTRFMQGSILSDQKTYGSTQTSRRYHWGDGHHPNRFKPAQTSIQNKPVCCFVRTKICILNIKAVETAAKA